MEYDRRATLEFNDKTIYRSLKKSECTNVAATMLLNLLYLDV